MQTPAELLAEFDAGAQETADIDIRETLFKIISDIQDSYLIAMADLSLSVRNKIHTEVSDYISNNYGD